MPPEGALVSLPAAPIELVDCHTVPVLLVKKWRVRHWSTVLGDGAKMPTL